MSINKLLSEIDNVLEEYLYYVRYDLFGNIITISEDCKSGYLNVALEDNGFRLVMGELYVCGPPITSVDQFKDKLLKYYKYNF